MGHLERRVLLGVLLGVVVYVVMALWADVDAVRRDVLGFEWGWLVAALALSAGNYVLRFAKWQYYLSRLSIHLPRGESLLVFLSSFLLTVTPGKVGEVVKSYLLKRTRNIAMSVTAPIVVAERLTDLLALFCLALVGLSTYAYGVEALAISGAVVLAGLVMLSTPRLVTSIIELLGRVPLIGRFTPRLHLMYDSMRVLIRPRALVTATALSVLGWGLECLAFTLIIGGFEGARPELVTATFLYAFTTILGALSFLPGGLGVTEGSMSVGLVELGMFTSESGAVAATYLIRLATLWFAVLVGLAAFVMYRRRYLSGDPLEPQVGT